MSLKHSKSYSLTISSKRLSSARIIDTQLHPRLPESFRAKRTALHFCQRSRAATVRGVQSRRTELLAMALQEFEGVTEEMNEEKRKLQIEQDKLASVLQQVKGEDTRLKSIKDKTRRIQNVQLVENRLLKTRRKNLITRRTSMRVPTRPISKR